MPGVRETQLIFKMYKPSTFVRQFTLASSEQSEVAGVVGVEEPEWGMVRVDPTHPLSFIHEEGGSLSLTHVTALSSRGG